MRIGLFGGAFNPIHLGHVKIAKEAIRQMSLDKLIVIPTGNAPHKKETEISREHRFNMAKLAFKDDDKIEVSDYELNREEISYSADTVEHFKKLYPNDEFFFIIGDDSYNNLSSWREPQRILNASTLLVFDRDGAEILPPAVKINMERIEISSSEIRDNIYTGKDFINLLPKSVFNYIIENNLYKRTEGIRFDGK
ncbi:MAG: nicotinate (nicotinamide) nucleotide adenylyltransferase [Clostridia bacterium]|nr:nicotinate (nicotinamide) nucleotide adenylyltransferase [Clostridia bacterium]